MKDKMPARVRPPGEITAYSNYGAVLAAYIVEQASGMPFDKYVDEKILKPLDMKNSTFEQPLPFSLAKNMSKGYIYSNNAYSAEPFEYVQVGPAGSMSSTAEDMSKFMIAHLQDGRYGNTSILQETTTRRMHSQLFTNDPRVSGWTYGFWEMRLSNQSIIGHGGDTILFHKLLELIPEHNLGIFASYNERSSEPAGVELLQAFLNRYYPVSSQVPYHLSGVEDNASKLEVSYRPTRSAYTNFERVSSLFQEVQVYPGPNSALTTSQLGLGQAKWVEVAPLVFRHANGTSSPLQFSDELVFGKDGQGNINHFFYDNPATAYEKVAWYDGANSNFTLLGACIILFLSTLIWPLSLLFKRSSAKPSRLERAARWLAGNASILNLLFMIGLVALSAAAPMHLVYSTPYQLYLLLVIPVIAAIIALASAVFVALAWKNGYWSIAGRLHYTLVVVALLAFVWWLNNWNPLGFRF